MTIQELADKVSEMGFFVKFFAGSQETYVYTDDVDHGKLVIIYEEPGMFNTNHYDFGNIPSMEKRRNLLGLIVKYSLTMPWLREAYAE